MMRKLIVMAMVAGLVGIGGFVKNASAGATVDLVFVSHNGVAISPTNTVTAAPGDTLIMNLIMSTTSQLSAHSVSLNYDLNPGGDLTPGHKGNWLGVALNNKNTIRYSPLSVPFSPTTPTFVGSWQSTNGASQTNFLPNSPGGGYAIGTIVWTNNTTAESDILAGLFNTGVDGFADNNFNIIDNTALFHGATVNPNVIPEPGTAGLLGLGLVGLVLAGRRNRR